MNPKEINIPKKGRNREDILKEMKAFGEQDPDYRKGKTWSLVYYLGEDYTNFLKDAHNLYFSENALNPMAFRSLRRFESEVIRMTTNLLNGDENVVGTMTSGGTESCLLAVKTYRDLARDKKPWIRKPEMILPETAHVAWLKGGEYFKVKVIHAPLDSNFKVDVSNVKRLIGKNTVMILGSAPQYPHGIVDPIEELGALASKSKIPLHVDACVGGYLLPFVEKLGYKVPKFDFSVPGVTSISADTHKYGYSAKGASTILYRNVDFLKYQMFVYENWPGGIFASPALLGTRPGGSIAAAWAAMQAMGEDGYLNNARAIMNTTERLIDGITSIPELEIIGKPHMSLFAYRSRSKDLSIYAVGDQMEGKGWHIDRQHRPECLHAMVTPLHAKVVKSYISDLKESVEHVRRNPALAEKGGAAMYGMISQIPMRGMVKKNVHKMMMDMYGPDGRIPDLGNTEIMNDVKGPPAPVNFATKAAMAFLKVKNRIGGRS